MELSYPTFKTDATCLIQISYTMFILTRMMYRMLT